MHKQNASAYNNIVPLLMLILALYHYQLCYKVHKRISGIRIILILTKAKKHMHKPIYLLAHQIYGRSVNIITAKDKLATIKVV